MLRGLRYHDAGRGSTPSRSGGPTSGGAQRHAAAPPRPRARARRRRRKPGMTQPSCVSDGESHLRTPHVSSFGAEACAAAASARPTSSHPRAELIIALASNRPWPWPARGALACCACGPAARVGLVSAGREASADRPPERPAPGAADPLLRTVEEPPPVRGRWHSSPTHPPRDPPSASPALFSQHALLPPWIPGARAWPMRRRGPWHAFRCAPRPRHRRARASLPSNGGGTMTRSAKHPVIPV